MWKHALKLGLAGLLGLAAAVPAFTQQSPSLVPEPAPKAAAAPALPPAPAGAGTLTKADVDAWLDGYMPYALARGDVAGAVVVVVKDGQVLTQRGFGYADVAARKPVDPERTLFRPGSTSKLFTWTAVMQQVEAGKLDLDADVNRYLDFRIPPYRGKPLTLREIMTHTSGFEEIIKGLLAFDKPVKPLGDVLKERIPERIFAPGSTPAYSNYATALAGYIVERVSGMKFDDYVERNIFQRLGMAHTSFRQPLPAKLRPLMSQGYELGSGKAQRYELIGLAPAGAAASSGADMAKFMIAHLNDGGPLLKPETARLMHTAQNKSVPGNNQMALGFYEQWIDGHRAIGHGGDTVYFHTELMIFPAEKVGVFISMNSAGKDGAPNGIRGALMDEFVDRYLASGPRKPPVELATAKEHARMLAGNWTVSRRIESSFASIVSLLGEMKVGLDDDGRPLIAGVPALGGAPRKWIEVAPFIWEDAYGHERLAAQVKDGKVVRWTFAMVSPFMVWDRTPWYASGSWLIPALIFALAVILVTAVSWPAGWIARRRYGAALALEGNARKAYRLTRGVSWLVLLVLAGWAVVISGIENFDTHGKTDWLILLLQVVGTIGFLGLFGLAAWNLWLAFRGRRGWFATLWAVLLLLGAFFVLWTALVFKLISFGTAF
ncbi:beta-lactamase family protein [Sphingomonas cannabina]|uniref:serine hydrolase domain-containing protein n=1 Tax=Sphingomonas cannabina TaxID=2899123 RepID=UPI001F3FDE97|nr:serine hydrolase domain-containing protein [Sphingomonas cannabina]UIJ46555.1 beta-lactamase family protein [Sphingomonas cannabina]